MMLKRVMLVVMCVLLITAIVMMGITVSKVSLLLQGVLGGSTPNPPKTTTAPQQSSTAPTQTDPSTSVPPTSEPTVPPTTLPTEPSTTPPTEPGHEHDYVLTETVPATCDNYGYNIYTCAGCGKQDIPFEEQVEPYGHSYGAGKVEAPTCTESGCTRYTCSRCGKIEDRNYRDALGHDYLLTESKAATCVDAGYDLYDCSRCDAQEQRNSVEAAGHNYLVVGETKEPSCTEDGFYLEQCQTCGNENSVTTPAHGHLFGEWVQSPDGGIERSCTYCDLLETSASLLVTNRQVSAAADGTKMYIVFVGSDTEPQMMVYTIYDQLNCDSIVCVVDPVRGLVVRYIDSEGQTVEQERFFLDTTPITIAADTTDPGVEPDPGVTPDPGGDTTEPGDTTESGDTTEPGGDTAEPGSDTTEPTT